MLTLNEFNNISEEEQKATLQSLKSEFSVKEIIEAWNISRSKFYSMLHKFKIPTEVRKPKKSNGQKYSSKAATYPTIQKPVTKRSNNKANELVVDVADVLIDNPGPNNKFSLQLDTQGSASLISETLQMILKSEQVANSTLHINLQIKQI